MFTFFAKNKLRYEKGQLVPIFIIVLVVLIIMAMVSVNLSKVAMTKTYGANGADAGALAGGSTMASLFNGIAQTNSTLETEYWMFYASYTVSFALAILKLSAAETKAGIALTSGTLAATAANPCAGLTPAAAANAAAVASAAQFLLFNKIITALNIAVLAFWAAQYFTYLSLRDTAEKQHHYAKGYSYTFAFANSGIGTKLRTGDPPDDVTDSEKKRDYQGSFSDFLTSISDSAKNSLPPDVYVYSWTDGQDRGHFVKINALIDKPDTFDLQVCVFPLALELADLLALLGLGLSAKADMAAAAEEYTSAFSVHDGECITCPEGSCDPAPGNGIAAGANITVTAVQGLIPSMYTLLAVSEAGLAPAVSINSTDGSAEYIIAWINDVVHNRLVKVYTQQHHAGSDLGLWETTYPDIYSYSIVNFNGAGSIYPPKLKFDSDITQTDKLNTGG